ncbi:MAG TPA: SRPBCC family protein, partial [Anaerolineae bacterium]|nr:SRPBCC family protein [Anaerolineae bacterium]
EMSTLSNMPVFAGAAVIAIQAPVNVVYDYLLDFTKHPQWVKNISKVQPLDNAPIGVGSQFKANEFTPPVSFLKMIAATLQYAISTFSGTKFYSLAEITALEPQRRIAWTGRLPRRNSDFNRSEWEIVLEPQGMATRVTQQFRFSPQTERARRMLEALGGTPGLSEACLVNLECLKHVLEEQAIQAVTK